MNFDTFYFISYFFWCISRSKVKSVCHHLHHNTTHIFIHFHSDHNLGGVGILFHLFWFPSSKVIWFISSDAEADVMFNLCVTICNTLQAINFALQAINFAFNFVLYCLINAKFRRTIHDLICCTSCRKRREYNSVTKNTKDTILAWNYEYEVKNTESVNLLPILFILSHFL